MRTQPTSTVDMDDVERIVRREYAPSTVPDIMHQIHATVVREKARVVLACLKVANGDRRRLEKALQDAPGYCRELLLEAEYPLVAKRLFRMRTLSDEERSSMYERDWSQYIAWLGRAALPSTE